MLDLPTDQGDVVARGLTALSDFAGGLNLDAAEIDKERGVVIEEWRGGLGAGSRVRDKQIPIIFYNSRYADRLPIGKPEILRTAPPAGCAPTTTRGIARSGRPSSRSATSIRAPSRTPSRPRSARCAPGPPPRRFRTAR